jgi:hypothetical protein
MMKDLTVTSGESILQWKEIYFIKWVINNSFLAHKKCDVHLQTSQSDFICYESFLLDRVEMIEIKLNLNV